MNPEYIEWLVWFYRNADFGPAHDDVLEIMQEQFTAETGIKLREWEE